MTTGRRRRWLARPRRRHVSECEGRRVGEQRQEPKDIATRALAAKRALSRRRHGCSCLPLLLLRRRRRRRRTCISGGRRGRRRRLTLSQSHLLEEFRTRTGVNPANDLRRRRRRQLLLPPPLLLLLSRHLPQPPSVHRRPIFRLTIIRVVRIVHHILGPAEG
jgi:hypothetical protein